MEAAFPLFACLILGVLSAALLPVTLCGQGIATARGEATDLGTIAGGSYLDTRAADGVYEVRTEQESGGRPQRRTSCLSHTWEFDVPPGSSVTQFVQAYHTANAEGDDFRVSWSTDGVSYQHLLVLTRTADDGGYESAVLPATVSGPLRIAVVDADRTAGNRSLDFLFVDHIYIESALGGPPVAPSGAIARDSSSSTIDITWTDLSPDEDGFGIGRRFGGLDWESAGIVGPDVTFFRDSGLLPSTTYEFVVYAFNAAGPSDPSNTTSATTRAPVSFAVERVLVVGEPTFTMQAMDLAHAPMTGHPAIAYTDGPAWNIREWVKLARWNGSSWTTEVVAHAEAGRILLFFAADGRPSIAYLSGSSLRYIEKVGSVWIDKGIDDQAGFDRTTMAHDASGEPAIAYYNRHRKGHLHLARRAQSSWSIEVVEQAAADVGSLAFGGRPAIAHFDASADGVKLARFDGSTWNDELVEGIPRVGGRNSFSRSGGGGSISLAFDPATGWPAFTHVIMDENFDRGELRLLPWTGVSWQVATHPVGRAWRSRANSLPRVPDIGAAIVAHVGP